MNTPHLEESFQREMEKIRSELLTMAALTDRALQQCMDALKRRDRQLAYAVILRDQFIDEREKGIDKLCLEFLVRQQPVGQPLRSAYAALKISLELERVGDYAESIARQIVKLVSMGVDYSGDQFAQIADAATQMVRDAIRAYVESDAELARSVIHREETVDLMKRQLNKRFIELFQEGRFSLEAFNALTTISRRYERVSDQARNISMETLYVCTGQFAKHSGAGTFRILFVDDAGTGAAQMAEAIGTAMNQPRFVFTGVSLEPQPIAPAAAALLQARGIDASRLVPRALNQVEDLDGYKVVVFLASSARKAFPQRAQKGVYLEWFLDAAAGGPALTVDTETGAKDVHAYLNGHIRDLVDAVLGSDQLKLEGV